MHTLNATEMLRDGLVMVLLVGFWFAAACSHGAAPGVTITLHEHPEAIAGKAEVRQPVAVHAPAEGVRSGWEFTLGEREARDGCNVVCDASGRVLPCQLEDMDGSGGPSAGDRIFVAAQPTAILP